MNDHAILETLRTGDVLNVSTTNPANGEVDVLFSVVLREEIGPNGTRLLYLSRLEHERPMAVPIRQNPYHWDSGVGTLVDRDGDPSLEL
ncbi:MAG TPA: hypothetical protein VJC18_02445, partial [bacterium]|nr:hypothetical protein [bacterium]